MFETLKKIVAIIVAFFTSLFGGGGKTPTPITTASQTVVMGLGAMNNIRQFEGACCDGEYVYQIFVDPTTSKTKNEKSVIVKINPKDWSVVKVSKEMTELNHANDVTYDPRIDLLMITNNAPNYTLVSAVYRDTLEYKAGMTIEHPLCTVCYCGTKEKGVYFAGISGSYDIGSYDGKFDTVETFTGIETGYVRQTMDTDNEYLYYLFSDPNCIYKYDLKGNYIGRVMLPNPDDKDYDYEAEGIFFYKEKMYVTYNIRGTGNGGLICRIDKAIFVK